MTNCLNKRLRAINNPLIRATLNKFKTKSYRKNFEQKAKTNAIKQRTYLCYQGVSVILSIQNNAAPASQRQNTY